MPKNLNFRILFNMLHSIYGLFKRLFVIVSSSDIITAGCTIPLIAVNCYSSCKRVVTIVSYANHNRVEVVRLWPLVVKKQLEDNHKLESMVT